jgi:phosphate transport system substrate-binding protein
MRVMSGGFLAVVAASGIAAAGISGCAPEHPSERASVGVSDAKADRETIVTGAGGTFAYAIYGKWADTYRKGAGVRVDYQAIGSAGGIKEIGRGTKGFWATDTPLTAEQLGEAGLLQFPTVVSGIAPVFNLHEIEGGRLVLDGKTLARIFLGEIRSWDDKAIQKLNPTLKLPRRHIAVVHRSDESGTTFVFTKYLGKNHAGWKDRVGVNTKVAWPVGTGARGDEGVAVAVLRTKGSIGYVEFGQARKYRVPHAWLINANGKQVEPSVVSFEAAAARAKWEDVPGFGVDLTDQREDRAWAPTYRRFRHSHAGGRREGHCRPSARGWWCRWSLCPSW